MTVDFHWQVQQVKQRLSEVLRAAESDGPQFVSRHGRDVAVVMSIADYERLDGSARSSFAQHVLDFPNLDQHDADHDDADHDALFARDPRAEERDVPFAGPGWR